MSQKDNLILESSLQSFFFDQLNDLNKKSSSPLPGETIYYSSLVMDRFGEAVEYFDVSQEGRVREKTLGVKLLEASSLSRTMQKRAYRDIGDTALFLCGYFSESLNKKIIDTSYYQEVGQIAYSHLNNIIPKAYEIPKFFGMISDTFEKITMMMNVVSKQNNMDGMNNDMILFVSNTNKIKAS
ncbi:MAG: hypothetical protein EP319_17560 [Deltaproteobacteria bacterium]|jgi:hypothetical protein|nr:MAG: hypothetical protein EP319_17560 [Deltaproteobacteria bacterium]